MSSVKSNGGQPSPTTNAVKEEPLPQPPCGPSLYKEGERVIARHGIDFYRAKIERIEFREDWRYRIHYIGWKKRWDEWVGVDRLLKFTDENSRILSHDTKHVAHKFAKSKKPLDTICLTDQKKQTDGKRKREEFEVEVEQEKERGVIQGKQINLSIPYTLKKQLLADFQFVNKMDKLVELPRVPNVDDILDKYQMYRANNKDMVSASLDQVISGVRVYFNKALPVILLYNKERQQYKEAIGDSDVSPSRVYGAEHLLRLFVKLPNLVNNVRIEKHTRRELQQNLDDILRFLKKNQSVFFFFSPMKKTAAVKR